MTRKVTEEDFRMPEYRDAKVEDYEFRPDGKPVRKDRWEMAVQSIRTLMGINAREFEIPEVVDAVRKMAELCSRWRGYDDDDGGERPDRTLTIDVELEDGSILRSVEYDVARNCWAWNGQALPKQAIGWRETYIRQGDSE